MAEGESPERLNRFFPAILFLVAVCLRLPFTSKFLYHHDSVNFALALEHFDLRLHQPHPPGYLLYVLLGRLLHFFIPDCNVTLITISVIFTSLTIVFIYLLGNVMYDRRSGIIAAVLAMVSPNLWFHGEVALSYGVESFFSVALAYLCWQLVKGKGELLFVAALCLGIAGGFRQNSSLFLLPLWLFSVRRVSFGKVLTGLMLVAALFMAWWVLTVNMTGGLEAYGAAFRSLWYSNTGHNSVFEKGWLRGWLFTKILATFTLYSLGAAIAGLLLGVCGMTRARDWKSVDPEKLWFFLAWLAPGFLFYQLIFIHPANPGYFLVLLPPLLLLAARGVIRTSDAVNPGSRKAFAAIVTAAVAIGNTAIFLASPMPVSANIIAAHDRNVAAILRELGTLNPATTAIVLKPFIFYGFRTVMFYLPQYHVYNSDDSTESFSGFNRRTVVSAKPLLPAQIVTAATVEFTGRDQGAGRLIPGLSNARMVSGPAEEIFWRTGGTRPQR